MEIAKGGKSGLEVYKNFLAKRLLFHIIFIDIDMPEMDGIEVTRLIRQLEREFSLKKNFICGLITDENNKFDVYHEEGMDEFLKKPVNLQVFNELIDRRLKQISQETTSEDPNDNHINVSALENKICMNENPVEPINRKEEMLDFEPCQLKLKENTYFLAIDDNDFILLGISHLKLSIAYKMDIAKGGNLGLAKYKEALKRNDLYHAIFIDIDMPEIDGLVLARTIRNIEKQYKITSTFLCALITEDNKDFDQYIDSGFNELLKKPVNPKNMEIIIEKIKPIKISDSNKVIKTKIEYNNLAVVKELENISLNFKSEITLLTVDDNDFILLGISHLKLDYSFKMDLCKNGVLALEKYQSMRVAGFLYHIIFMDIEMPIMDGLECTKKIRELEKTLQGQKSFIVGLINDDYKDIEKYLEIGMNEFVNKPVNPKSMNNIIKKRVEELNFLKEQKTEKIIQSKKNENSEFKLNEICTLMAVDDNDFILMGISHLKCGIKYKMELSKNGKQALEKYYKNLDAHFLFHIIFMDIDMPEMNGLECTKKIRELEKSQGIPRTCIVGLINDDYKDIEKYLEAGMDEFINKPVNPNAFSSLITKQIEDIQKKNEKLITNQVISNEITGQKNEKIETILNFPEEVTLLAVDDNDFILIGLSHLKLTIKYKMEVCKNSKKAFEKFKEYIEKGLMFQAIFIDIDMPEISGLQLTKMIREYEKLKEINLNIFIVGLITDENKDIELYLEAGMNEFLNKPVHPKAMNELLIQRLLKIKEFDDLSKKKGDNNQNGVSKRLEKKPIVFLKLNEEILTMLAVDDNDFILLGISHLKIKGGNIKYRMETTKFGKDAYEKFLKMIENGKMYHCIFIDIEMPIMNGLELTKKIRDYEIENNIETKCLICGLLTEDTTDIEKYKEIGINDFLNKPVHPVAMNTFLEMNKLI